MLFPCLLLLILQCKTQEIRTLSPKNLTNCQNNRCDFELNFDVKLPQPYGDIRFVDPYRNYNDTKAFTNGQSLFTITASQNFAIVDSQMTEQLICLCPSSASTPVTTSPCNVGATTGTTAMWQIEVAPTDPANDCSYQTYPAECCYMLTITSQDYYEVYTGITSAFANLQLTYSKQNYNLVHAQPVSMVDLNVTLLGLTNIMQPLDSMAVIVDVNGNARVVDKSMINQPNEHSTSKAGWWTQNTETTKINFNQLPTQISPRNLRYTSNLNITQARTLPSFSNLTVQANYQGNPGSKITQARIVTNDSISQAWIDYNPTNTTFSNFTTLVDENPQLICLSYPTICICTPGASWNLQRCLPLKGKIRLFASDNSIFLGLIDATWSLSYTVASSLNSLSYLSPPPLISLNIQSDIAIQPLIVQSASPYILDAYNYTKNPKYVVMQINTYPSAFIIETDTNSIYVTLTMANTTVYVNWNQPIFTIYDVSGANTVLPRKIVQDSSTTYIPSTDEVYDVINNPGSLLQAIFKQIYNLWFWITLGLWCLAWYFAYKKNVLDWSFLYVAFGIACLFPFWAIWLIPFYLFWCHHKHRSRENYQSESRESLIDPENERSSHHSHVDRPNQEQGSIEMRIYPNKK